MKSTGAWSSYQLHRLQHMRGCQDNSTSNGHQVICLIDCVMLRRNWIINFPVSNHRIFLFVFIFPLTAYSYFSESSFLMSSFACDYHTVLCWVFIPVVITLALWVFDCWCPGAGWSWESIVNLSLALTKISRSFCKKWNIPFVMISVCENKKKMVCNANPW